MERHQRLQRKKVDRSSSISIDRSSKLSPFAARGFGVQQKASTSTPASKTELWENYQRSTQMGQNGSQKTVLDRSTPIQAKLSIGQPGDKYEQEADSVADRVMAMSEPAQVQREELAEEEELQMKPLAGTISPLVQREELQQEEEELQMKPEDNVVQREALPEEEEELQMKSLDNSIQREELPEEEEELQMKQSSPSTQTAPPNLESQLSSSKGGGSPLSDDVRSFMEPRFGADFSGVRVHTGSDAVQMNRDVNAQAFAHGSDVYFGAGKAPGNDALTAHELTHVVQQTGGGQAIQRSVLDEFKIESQAKQADEDTFFGREQPPAAAQTQAGTLLDIPDNINQGISPGKGKGKSASLLDIPIDEATETNLEQPSKADNAGGKYPGFKYQQLALLGKDYKSEELLNDEADADLFGYETNPKSMKSGPYSEAVGGSVKHVQIDEQSKYELTSQSQETGDPAGTTNTVFYWRGKPFETKEMSDLALSGKGGRAIFVMTVTGKIYVADPNQEVNDSELLWKEKMSFDRFHHSSFLRGSPVAAAGELVFNDGILKTISNQSGHYKPGVEHMMQVLQEFKERGVSLKGVELELFIVDGGEKGLVTIDADGAFALGARTQAALLEAIRSEKLPTLDYKEM